VLNFTPNFVSREPSNSWTLTEQTFTREEAAKRFGVSRTTLWRIESRIVLPAKILDYQRYVKSHPTELDWYCVWVLSNAIGHLKGEGSYAKASEVMRQQQLLYLKRNFDEIVKNLATQNVRNKRRNVA
jgi:transcriptional regulator with XRE-family HTH domain